MTLQLFFYGSASANKLRDCAFPEEQSRSMFVAFLGVVDEQISDDYPRLPKVNIEKKFLESFK